MASSELDQDMSYVNHSICWFLSSSMSPFLFLLIQEEMGGLGRQLSKAKAKKRERERERDEEE